MCQLVSGDQRDPVGMERPAGGDGWLHRTAPGSAYTAGTCREEDARPSTSKTSLELAQHIRKSYSCIYVNILPAFKLSNLSRNLHFCPPALLPNIRDILHKRQ